MSLDPADRFPSMRAMGNALLAFASPKTLLAWGEYFGEATMVAVATTRSRRRWRRRQRSRPSRRAPEIVGGADRAGRTVELHRSLDHDPAAIPRACGSFAGLALVAAVATLVWWKRRRGAE